MRIDFTGTVIAISAVIVQSGVGYKYTTKPYILALPQHLLSIVIQSSSAARPQTCLCIYYGERDAQNVMEVWRWKGVFGNGNYYHYYYYGASEEILRQLKVWFRAN